MKKIILFLSIFCLVGFSMHDIHLSFTNVVLNTKSNSLDITMRCFIEDIEDTINKLDSIESELDTDREIKDVDTYLKKYVLNNFKINVNNKEVTPEFLGKEYEKDIVFFYLTLDSISSIETLEVENTVLFDAFDDQQNVIKIRINDLKETLYLTHKNDKEMLNFSE